MPSAVVGLGANLGDARRTLQAAVYQLQERYSLVEFASLYQSASVGGPPQPAYLNSGVKLAVRSQDTPEALLGDCLAVERALGRERTGELNAPRTLDLDLWWYDGQTVDTHGLTLPHPRAHRRRFVLLPFRELMPGLVLRGRTLDAWLLDINGQPVCRVEGPSWPWMTR
ncbi:MAG: 2-amino-4-hydroxy-6-hydroxymethyldihydropteridine diphosphokinase [Thermaerobacter sp.]|nr:2-amino-4-hydroxy-6-hydroxymethyldihydropteridine diphosphokinase [Thermaerobacter sp.]